MKTITVNPSILEAAHAWAQANPMEFYGASVALLMSVCYVLKDAI